MVSSVQSEFSSNKGVFMTDFRENFQFPSLNDAMDKELYYLDKNWTSGDYDAMLNLAKSIVESTCKFICYQDNPKNDLNGNLDDLLKSMLKVLNIDVSKNDFYSKLKEIITKIGDVRNHTILSHGHRKQNKSIQKEEARFYSSVCIDFSTYFLKIFSQTKFDRHRIGELIEPENSEYVNLKINGYKVQLRECLGYVNSACIDFYKKIGLESAIQNATAVINAVLPLDADWKNREKREESDIKFKVYSQKYDRDYDVVFEEVNQGWLIYIDNISTEFLDGNVKNFRDFLSIDEKYNFGNSSSNIIKERKELNKLISNKNVTDIRKLSIRLIKDIGKEICNQNNWEKPRGDVKLQVKTVISKFQLIIGRYELLWNVLNKVLEFIMQPKLKLKKSEDYILYAALIDDISIFLINLNTIYKRKKQELSTNVIGGIFNLDDMQDFSNDGDNEFLSTNPVLDIRLALENGYIEKIAFKFKTLSTRYDEFVNDTIRDYLPSQIESVSSSERVKKYHLIQSNKYCKEEYWLSNGMLNVVLKIINC
ncbi:abortive infection family protein [Lactobacillus kefiranofaciens]|uniref:abortive infection family protein n=1 Tax=Lactobacillus kefiranofaciens TaxID=267818 RepID=UPI00117AEDA8|nr:abortive infection family protein [Lactobacillus kefiranofaciens]